MDIKFTKKKLDRRWDLMAKKIVMAISSLSQINTFFLSKVVYTGNG
jgi:hypothetical protein